jgi:hypothetical protein
MRSLYYLKWPLVIFVSGYITRVIGALFKIRHWPYADLLLTIGSVIMVSGLVFLAVKLIVYKKEI